MAITNGLAYYDSGKPEGVWSGTRGRTRARPDHAYRIIVYYMSALLVCSYYLRAGLPVLLSMANGDEINS